MNHPAEDVVVFTLPPSPNPWNLYIGKSDQKIDEMVYVWSSPTAPVFSAELAAEIEEYLFRQHNIIVVSPWDKEVECRIAYYSRA